MNQVNSKFSPGGRGKGLSPLAVWAFAFGASVGWGSFVMPGNTFLPKAGWLGSAIGLFLGAAILLVIALNYHDLMNRCPDEGGAYSYTAKYLGADHGFLCSWLLILTYAAIIWANLTALALIVRALPGDPLRWGFSYTVVGYEVYFGEIVASVLLMALVCFVCIAGRRLLKIVQTVFALALFLCVAACFVAVVIHRGGFSGLAAPAFAPNGSGIGAQIFSIVILAPWAYIGFESVSHATGDFRFSAKKSIWVLAASLLTGAITYVSLAVIASFAYPDGYESWLDYILQFIAGNADIPTFYNAEAAIGTPGIVLLGVAAVSGIVTGLIANSFALGRLLHALAKDNLMPSAFTRTTRRGKTPYIALLVIAAVSVVIPFFGRKPVVWIVDVTTVGAAIVYAYVSIAAFVAGRAEKKKRLQITGIAGAAVSAVISVYYLIPSFWSDTDLFSTESFFILGVWSLLGIAVFRLLLKKDRWRRLGKSEAVWIILLILILVISVVWIRQSAMDQAKELERTVTEFHENEAGKHGEETADHVQTTNEFVTDRINWYTDSVVLKVIIQTTVIGISLYIVFRIFEIIKKREQEIEAERLHAVEMNKAKSVFLSNMSHDLRTPMNAVTGYTALALKEPDLSPKTREYLEKIDFSSRHLLSLINDVLDMSRIESGKVELEPEPADLVQIFNGIYDIFLQQMQGKNLRFTVDRSGVKDSRVVCDPKRVNRILLNLVSNALKYTPEGGEVRVTAVQTGRVDDRGEYRVTVADTGIGMSAEYVEHLFESFSRERSKTVSRIQGTGLGMAITKSLVELMGGSIAVDTAPGKGTTFTLSFSFPIVSVEESAAEEKAEEEDEATDLSGKKILVVDDNPINVEIACMILQDAGFVTETAQNGKEAADLIASSPDGRFDIILMDVQMPVMNGYDATRAIRALGGAKGAIPIVAMTANAFSEDVQEARAAGMNAHVTKPVEVQTLLHTLKSVLHAAQPGR